MINDYKHTFPLPELGKLKTLSIDNLFLSSEEQLKTLTYHDLEIFKVDSITINTASCMIKNCGTHLRKILLKYSYFGNRYTLYKDSLILIRTIYENCPLVEYLSLIFPSSKEHFIEFEKLLKVCRNLKSFLLNIQETFNERILEKGEELLKILIRSSSTNLREIRFFDNFKFSLKSLEEFLEKWRDRPALSILTCDPIYIEDEYVKLINKYKNDGVIKDFKYFTYYHSYEIYY